jgi:hypothetical protein
MIIFPWMENHGVMGNPIVQYLHQQQQEALNRAFVQGQYELGSPSHTIPHELPMSRHVIGTALPAMLSRSTDEIVLTTFQVFLCRHIQVFAATREDVSSRVRGRHKQVLLHQAGIRCRHCAHISASQRTKGAVYFPSSTMGIYQAAQNMCTTHLQCGSCLKMPESDKILFAQSIGTKTAGSSSAGALSKWAWWTRKRVSFHSVPFQWELYHFKAYIQ